MKWYRCTNTVSAKWCCCVMHLEGRFKAASTTESRLFSPPGHYGWSRNLMSKYICPTVSLEPKFKRSRNYTRHDWARMVLGSSRLCVGVAKNRCRSSGIICVVAVTEMNKSKKFTWNAQDIKLPAPRKDVCSCLPALHTLCIFCWRAMEINFTDSRQRSQQSVTCLLRKWFQWWHLKIWTNHNSQRKKPPKKQAHKS